MKTIKQTLKKIEFQQGATDAEKRWRSQIVAAAVASAVTREVVPPVMAKLYLKYPEPCQSIATLGVFLFEAGDISPLDAKAAIACAGVAKDLHLALATKCLDAAEYVEWRKAYAGRDDLKDETMRQAIALRDTLYPVRNLARDLRGVLRSYEYIHWEPEERVATNAFNVIFQAEALVKDASEAMSILNGKGRSRTWDKTVSKIIGRMNKKIAKQVKAHA